MYKITLRTTLLLALGLLAPVLSAKDIELGCVSGDCVNGSGTLVEETARGIRTYRGDFIDGVFNGYGRLSYDDEGETYKGRFVSGKKQGQGTLWDAKGNVYIGEWRNDRRNGRGVQAFHVEEWREGEHSVVWLEDNTENYSGEFKNDVFYGQGTYRWEDGTRYVGQWAANKKHGRGYFDHGTGYKGWRNYEFDKRIYDERFE